MSTVHLCDYPKCGKLATYCIAVIPYVDAPSESSLFGEPKRLFSGRGMDTCDDHYNITHPGRDGGGWWDDIPAPQR